MQHKVITIGAPSVKNLTNEQVNSFYSVLLTQAIENKCQKAKEEECPTNEQRCTSTEVTT